MLELLSVGEEIEYEDFHLSDSLLNAPGMGPPGRTTRVDIDMSKLAGAALL
jgi:hypothetical protein